LLRRDLTLISDAAAQVPVSLAVSFAVADPELHWLARTHSQLVSQCRELYRRGAYLPPLYRDALQARAAPLIARYGLTGDQRRRDTAQPQRVAATSQLTLF
jgi:hypothetical protein